MAWKNFQNGYPLYASELNNYLMNQAVATFASSAERASVLTSPVEGQVTWLQDTNAFQVYNGTAWVDINDNTGAIQKSLLTTQGDIIVRNGTAPARLGIGTSGQVLQSNGTTAQWSTISAGGMALISTTTLSGSSTVLSGISQTYKKLVLWVVNTTINSGTQRIHIKPNSTGGQTWYTGTVNSSVSSGTNDQIGSYLATTTGSADAVALEIDNYTSTNSKKTFKFYGNGSYSGGASNETVNFAGMLNTNSAVSSLQLENVSGGTMTGGTAYLYGVN